MLKRGIKCGGIQPTEFGETNLENLKNSQNLDFFLLHIYINGKITSSFNVS
jgi:hypothetical protein